MGENDYNFNGIINWRIGTKHHHLQHQHPLGGPRKYEHNAFWWFLTLNTCCYCTPSKFHPLEARHLNRSRWKEHESKICDKNSTAKKTSKFTMLTHTHHHCIVNSFSQCPNICRCVRGLMHVCINLTCLERRSCPPLQSLNRISCICLFVCVCSMCVYIFIRFVLSKVAKVHVRYHHRAKA